jgi:HlyD family secretion protein
MSIDKKALEELRIDRSRTAPPTPWGKLAIICLLLLIGVGAFLLWTNQKSAVVVRTSTVIETAGSGQQTVLNASGYVTARRQATVSSKITGQIMEVLFEEGQKVEAGQILARVDPANIKTGLRLAEAQLEVARAALKETTAHLAQAGRELKRALSLATNQVASPAEVDKVQSESDSLEARLARQQTEVTVAQRQIANWEQQMEDTVIRAPFAGIVVSKTAQPGEIISPLSAGGAFTRTGICTLVDMASLEVEVDVNENFINRVEPAQPVQATLDAYADWKIPAKVITIIPTADRQKATVKVRIGFDKLDPRMLPDMGVKVSFQSASETASTARAITIPKSAVRNEGGRDIVWVMQQGRVERRAVTIGATRNDEVVVLSNLTGGEKVILEGPTGLKEGDPVRESNQ